MSASQDHDQTFDENLHLVGGRITAPDGPSDGLRSRCLAEFRPAPRRRRPFALFRRPVLASTVGLAACLALTFGLLFPANGGPKVEAATILAKLKVQIAEPELIDLRIDSISVDEASVDGHIQVAKNGIAGDVHVVVTENKDAPIEVDAAFGVGADGGWVLVRKLNTADPDVQTLVDVLLPPGTETLLLLPDDVDLPGLEVDIADGMKELSTAHKMVETFTRLVQEQPDTDATVRERRDGTIVLTLPIRDAQSLRDFARMAATAANEEAKRLGEEDEIDLDEIDVHIDDDDIGPLLGSTLEVVYDPSVQLVRRFSITDFGKDKGSVIVTLGEGGIDEDLLDASRVTGPNTRTIDLTALKSLIENLSD